NRTAHLIAQGESAAADEERFKKLLIRRAPALGVIFIVAGILFVINIVSQVALLAIAKLFPVLLILLGGYLLTKYFKRSRERVESSDPPRAPYSLVPGSYGDRESGNVRRLSRPGER
ncbi:MAG TPA: hypothetical protein VLE20_10035, partial [Blastocatellia bacterium]|nr:hypothetical protein [Blastocatellia bacterium]